MNELKLNQNGKYYQDAETQREQILDWLRSESITTLQARKELDIMSPAARVLELRKQGYNIMTHWTIEDSGKGQHRIARYVLLMAVQS
jgi:hypothetical protein